MLGSKSMECMEEYTIMKKYTHSALAVALFLAACVMLVMAGSAMAAHPPIPLLDTAGNAIATPAPGTPAPAFSVKETCGACHGNPAYPDLLGYDAIEKHSYHAQLGANQLAEWNPANPKPWGQQSPGHFGKW